MLMTSCIQSEVTPPTENNGKIETAIPLDRNPTNTPIALTRTVQPTIIEAPTATPTPSNSETPKPENTPARNSMVNVTPEKVGNYGGAGYVIFYKETFPKNGSIEIEINNEKVIGELVWYEAGLTGLPKPVQNGENNALLFSFTQYFGAGDYLGYIYLGTSVFNDFVFSMEAANIATPPSDIDKNVNEHPCEPWPECFQQPTSEPD